jgi:hypothetical protein
METRERRGGQGQGDMSGQDTGQQQDGRKEQGSREDQSGRDRPSTGPTPSGVPNEGRGTDAHHGSLDQGVRTGKADYEYKDGRESTGGQPNERRVVPSKEE